MQSEPELTDITGTDTCTATDTVLNAAFDAAITTSWTSHNRTLVAQWESEISLSSLVGLNKNVSFINEN